MRHTWKRAALELQTKVERLRSQAVQDFERWGAEKLRLEAELERLREAFDRERANHMEDEARLHRIEEAARGHRCIIHFTAEDGMPAMRPNDGVALRAALEDEVGKHLDRARDQYRGALDELRDR